MSHPGLANILALAARVKTGLSQVNFSNWFGFSAGAVCECEQGRQQPEGSTHVLLLVIASKPELVDEVLAAAAPKAA